VNLVLASALFLLPWAVVLVQVLRHRHLDSGAIGLVATLSLGLPGLWLAVAGYLEAGRSAHVGGFTMAHVADQLAIAVGTEWKKEADIRRLNDPYPLPVSWAAADASLTDSWDSLVRLASSGAGWPEVPPAGTWAAGPDELAGEGRELLEVLAKVPTGRLAVLGEPGAGKTMLMVRLVLDLLARRTAGDPVPILASVASWSPAYQDLRGWLGARLLFDYPFLASPPPGGRTEATQAAALLASGLIMPVLDGLDEIPEQVRGPAISRINSALQPAEWVVVTCRAKEYQDSVRPKSGVEATFRGAAAVQLRPLDADTVGSYLCADAPGPDTKILWEPVLKVLASEAPARQALTTPLMVGLARTIYNPRPGDGAGARRDPVELCSPALANRTEVEALLFDAFIPAAYRADTGSRWKPQDAERWLVFLARHLQGSIEGPNLAWWQLQLALPRTALGRLVLGYASWAGVFVFVFGLALVTGHVVGFAAGLWVGLILGIFVGLYSGLIYGNRAYKFWQREMDRRREELALRGPGGLAMRGQGGLVRAASPGALLARYRRQALLLMLGIGLVAGLGAGLGLGTETGSGSGSGSRLGPGSGSESHSHSKPAL
jgi:hypothetical protein